MKELLLATNNPKKVKEIRDLMQRMNYRVLTPRDLNLDFDVEETGTTFRENAQLKSSALYKLTGIPSLADDSGICVESLQGAPGVYSARYGSPNWTDRERAEYLLENMKSFINRRAHYFCSISYSREEGTEFFDADVHGVIEWDYDEKGKFGFGYDPIFYYPPFGERFSRVPTDRKNQISHRGKALRAFIHYINKF
ncbi:MAG: RdgB/HAM1 family non-canonical purine NTP pyrophosphatase [Leptospiraceae bacterium]|nr:RdgB/HAM1 family non-canonical purine NTP pyrophosphatase [Leptospiraceae bacterium]